MSTATETDRMAKKRDKPERSERKDEPVRIDSEVLRIARIVASYEEKSLSDYLSESLRPIVERDHSRHIKKYTSKGDPGSDR